MQLFESIRDSFVILISTMNFSNQPRVRVLEDFYCFRGFSKKILHLRIFVGNSSEWVPNFTWWGWLKLGNGSYLTIFRNSVRFVTEALSLREILDPCLWRMLRYSESVIASRREFRYSYLVIFKVFFSLRRAKSFSQSNMYIYRKFLGNVAVATVNNISSESKSDGGVGTRGALEMAMSSQQYRSTLGCATALQTVVDACGGVARSRLEETKNCN